MPTDLPLGPYASLNTRRLRFLDLEFDSLSLDETVGELQQASSVQCFRYVVTPNVDHMVRLTDRSGKGDCALWEAYRGADWCVCDSRVLAAVAKAKGVTLPVVPGSDLTARLLGSVGREGDLIALVGGTEEGRRLLQLRYPHLRFVQHIPPMGLQHNPAAMNTAAHFVVSARGRFVLLAVGSPQQELLAAKIAGLGEAVGIGLCIGAAADFLAGLQKRAPVALQRMGLEWAHRLATNPRRLWKRYLIDGPRIFWRVARWERGAEAKPFEPSA